MGYTSLKDKIFIAHKKYRCDAYIQLFNKIGMNDLTSDEQYIVRDFKAKGACINVGDKYHYIVGISNGDFMVFRANIEMLKLYYKYEIYEE